MSMALEAMLTGVRHSIELCVLAYEKEVVWRAQLTLKTTSAEVYISLTSCTGVPRNLDDVLVSSTATRATKPVSCVHSHTL